MTARCAHPGCSGVLYAEQYRTRLDRPLAESTETELTCLLCSRIANEILVVGSAKNPTNRSGPRALKKEPEA